MLSDPFLQLPTETTIRVVWFTEFSGHNHYVIYGENLTEKAPAVTKKLTRVREDEKSKWLHKVDHLTYRDIWRHEATITGLTPGKRVPYQAISDDTSSRVFSLASLPEAGKPLKILLTSDHQLMPMTAANLQKVAETIGRVDAIFFAGDLVNIPDRASEWFDDTRGCAFFPCLQGRANYQLNNVVYHGGELIQHAPLFPAIGNHEVMGRFSESLGLNEQFADAFPLRQAQVYYQLSANPHEYPSVEADYLKANSFNTDTYKEIFTLPKEKYYSVSFGDIWLGVLYVTNIWRSPSLDPQVKGRYQEKQEDLNNPISWGYGQHIFEPISKDSEQYQWLKQQLNTQEFKSAKYKLIMFHHPPHTLGGNIVPPYTDPIPSIEYADDGSIKNIRYNYPQDKDYIIVDLIPLLESAGVDLVYFGHSHLWNRFVIASGMHFLESSNVGNSYGAHVGDNKRLVPKDNPQYHYVEIGDPNGLDPVVPTIFPLVDDFSVPLPYIASNDITVFSILDTATATVSSYRFDTSSAESEVIKFDEFIIGSKINIDIEK